MVRKIKLHGDLAEQYGSEYDLEVTSAAEAVRALCANFPTLERHLYAADDRGVGYQVLVDGDQVDESELARPASRTIEIVPVIKGAGGANSKIIIGSALLVTGAVLSATGVGAGFGVTLMKVGASLTIAGVIQQFTPVPKAPSPTEKPGSDPSFVFNGPVNTTAQGQPVPVLYGRLTVGSAVISAGITVDQIISPQQQQDAKGVGFSGTLYL